MIIISLMATEMIAYDNQRKLQEMIFRATEWRPFLQELESHEKIP